MGKPWRKSDESVDAGGIKKMNEKFLRPEWQRLEGTERRALLKQLGERYGMELKEYAHFSRYGQETDTAVYLYQNSEFVFVPGDTVTLGYDYTAVKFDLRSKAALYEEIAFLEDLPDGDFSEDRSGEELESYVQKLEEAGIEKKLQENYLKVSFTPVRKAEIPPMLVERRIRDPFWHTLALDDSFITEHYAEKLEEFKKGNSHMCTYSYIHTDVNALRFIREDNEIRAERCEPLGRKELIERIQDMKFSLPTEDEWEYLCGGGCRTLFPWGESFYKELLERQKGMKDLEKPNFFGLLIAYDSYQQEIMLDKGLKGGDGGVACCGGWDAMSCLCASPYFTPEFMEEEGDEDYLMPNYNFIRRVIRIAE